MACSPTNYPNTICCSAPSWPASGDCGCFVFACLQIGTTCSCGYVAKPGLTVCTGTYCCSGPAGCDCGDQPCAAGTTQVTQCDDTTYRCGDLTEVPACR
jgi:hypothetical protein